METEPEMTDKELINYCDRHCKTPRAMFSISQVRRMIKLSGVDAEIRDYVKWMSLKEEMQDMVDKARENLSRAGGKIT